MRVGRVCMKGIQQRTFGSRGKEPFYTVHYLQYSYTVSGCTRHAALTVQYCTVHVRVLHTKSTRVLLRGVCSYVNVYVCRL